MANAYMDKIEAFVRANEENVIRDIKRLVDIPSVAGTPEPGAPNGAGPAAALKEALALAGEMGLATGEFEGHMGWAELPGSTTSRSPPSPIWTWCRRATAGPATRSTCGCRTAG